MSAHDAATGAGHGAAAGAARGVVAVTGAGRGIGAAIAQELARRGFEVACLVRGDAPAAPAGAPGRIARIGCDIRDPQAVADALAAADALPGGLKGIVNNAGVQQDGPARDFPLAAFEAMLATNVIGTFSVAQQGYPLLRARGGGLIVNIGSMWDKMGVRRYAAYCASKAAVAALGRCLAAEWARDGIRVLTVAPGYVDTPMTHDALEDERVRAFLKSRVPMGRAASAEEVARLVASLYGEDIAMFTGDTLYIDGGHGIGQ